MFFRLNSANLTHRYSTQFFNKLYKISGYPCSLWTLFHALTVNAALRGDPSMQVGGTSLVVQAMIGYIPNFFSCRPCAQHFVKGVDRLGTLPSTPNASILWLWQFHNMANSALKGNI